MIEWRGKLFDLGSQCGIAGSLKLEHVPGSVRSAKMLGKVKDLTCDKIISACKEIEAELIAVANK